MFNILELNKIHNMNCLEGLKLLDDNSVDSIVTDPPYGLGFMGKEWDNFRESKTNDAPIYEKGLLKTQGKSKAPWLTDKFREENVNLQMFCEEWAKECLRVLKPRGYLLSFGGTRTYHRMACAIEDAGFEIRDQIMWVYGSGFPKSMDISKALDKSRARTSEDIKKLKNELRTIFDNSGLTLKELNNKCGFEASGYLRQSSSWESVLPTEEKWNVMRNIIGTDKDFSSEFKKIEREIIGKSSWTNSVHHFIPGENHTERIHLNITAPSTEEAKQWEGWGTALKPAHEPIVVARKPLSEKTVAENVLKWNTGGINIDGCRVEYEEGGTIATNPSLRTHINGGNGGHIISTETERRVVIPNSIGRFPANIILDEEAGKLLDKQSGITKSGKVKENKEAYEGESNTKFLRGKSTSQNQHGDSGGASRFFYCAKASKKERGEGNTHPTVKPLSLMQYLVRLVTPLNGIVLDPFVGSGTTCLACINENFQYIGFELDTTYCDIANERIQDIVTQ